MLKIHELSAALVEASVNLEQKIHVLKQEKIDLHHVLSLTWDAFKVLMEPLWLINQDFLKIYEDLDCLYSYLVDLAKYQNEIKNETMQGVEMMARMKKILRELTHKSRNDQGKYNGSIYHESINTGKAIIQELKSDSLLITKNIQDKKDVDDERIEKFKFQVEQISTTLIDISKERYNIASKWVSSAISDIEILQTKVEGNLDLLVESS